MGYTQQDGWILWGRRPQSRGVAPRGYSAESCALTLPGEFHYRLLFAAGLEAHLHIREGLAEAADHHVHRAVRWVPVAVGDLVQQAVA